MNQPMKQFVTKDALRGLVCRACGCQHFRVLYTRRAWGGRLLRRRTCRHCGRRITTYEVPASDAPALST